MTLLIVETVTWKPHVETGMEIALSRHGAGEKVVYANLRDGLPACEDEHRSHWLFDLPSHRIRRGTEILRRHGIDCPRLAHSRADVAAALALADTLLAGCRKAEDVQRLTYREFYDIGWSVVSSVASVTRNSQLSLSEHHDLLRRYLASAILVFDRTRTLIRQLQPVELIAFNGRFATTRAALRAAEASQVSWRVHERGADKDHYWLVDSLPHDFDRIQEAIRRQWSPEAAEAGHRFFVGRRERVERAWHSFTKDQEQGLLPDAMHDAGTEWVTFFTSSEDEMLSIGDRFVSAEFPSQSLALEAVATAVAKCSGLRLCVRVHPHIARKSRADREKWRQLKLPGALIIGPEERFDSYALLDRSRVVCTYGSTMGIEATYWNRPSLLFSRSFYDRLDAVEIARNADQIVEFLRHPVTRPRESTLAFGAFWDQLGQPYRHYRADSLHGGTICGVNLDDSPWILAGKWLQKILRRLGKAKDAA